MVDINSSTFWLVGVVWFTVPILSWFWSLASIYYYRKLVKILSDSTKAFEQIKALNEQMVNYRTETFEIRTKAEEELKLACSYYSKLSNLLSNKGKMKT